MKHTKRCIVHKWREVLVVLFFAALLIFAIGLYDIVLKVDSDVFEAQWAEKENAAQLICDMIDYKARVYSDWDERGYSGELTAAAVNLDSWPGVVARLYDADLNLMSERVWTPGETPVILLDYPEITSLIKREQSGVNELTVVENGENTPIRLYHRWIPSNHRENRVLLVVGMMPNALLVNPSEQLTAWCNRMLVLAGLALVTAMIVILVPHPHPHQYHPRRRDSYE
jgi:hypothetical protein